MDLWDPRWVLLRLLQYVGWGVIMMQILIGMFSCQERTWSDGVFRLAHDPLLLFRRAAAWFSDGRDRGRDTGRVPKGRFLGCARAHPYERSPCAQGSLRVDEGCLECTLLLLRWPTIEFLPLWHPNSAKWSKVV